MSATKACCVVGGGGEGVEAEQVHLGLAWLLGPGHVWSAEAGLESKPEHRALLFKPQVLVFAKLDAGVLQAALVLSAGTCGTGRGGEGTGFSRMGQRLPRRALSVHFGWGARRNLRSWGWAQDFGQAPQGRTRQRGRIEHVARMPWRRRESSGLEVQGGGERRGDPTHVGVVACLFAQTALHDGLSRKVFER